MSRPLTRSGRLVHDVAAAPEGLRGSLADLATVAHLLSPPLDLARSQLGTAPPVWRLPTLGLGHTRHAISLVPHLASAQPWRLVCTEAPDSDIAVVVELELELQPRYGASRAVARWGLTTDLTLPGPLLLVARRAVDRVVDELVRSLLDRAAAR